VWVANRGSGTVSQITPAAGAVTDTITVATPPKGIAVGGGSVWVANGVDGTLSQIDARRQPAVVVKTTKLANPPQGIAVSGNGVYVAVRSTGREHRGGTLTATVGQPIDFIDPALAIRLLAGPR
jgi:YVTN family beta-propeller protein